jgi:hypothetical protein
LERARLEAVPERANALRGFLKHALVTLAGIGYSLYGLHLKNGYHFYARGAALRSGIERPGLVLSRDFDFVSHLFAELIAIASKPVRCAIALDQHELIVGALQAALKGDRLFPGLPGRVG